MSLSRRKFLKLSLNSAVIITAGNILRPLGKDFLNNFSADDLLCRFAIASDGHYGQADTQYGWHHNQMIHWINLEKNKRGVDFTVINGDVFHNDVSYLKEVKSKWDNLTMPYYVSHGNHDQTDEVNWASVWNLPWNFTFEHKDAGFIVLNTADRRGNFTCPDVEWTKTHLQQYAAKKQLFVFMHITPFTWTKGGNACPAIVELFDQQPNLKAVFHGHDHDQDDVKENNGKHYFFDSHVAGDWGTAYNGYRVVEIFKDGQVLTYQMNPSSKKQVNNNTIS